MAVLSQGDRTRVFPLDSLVPSRPGPVSESGARHLAPRGRVARSIFNTMPILLVGSLALATMNLTGALDNPNSRRPSGGKSETDHGATIRAALAAANSESHASVSDGDTGTITVASVPATYRVRGGDTVSSIAGKHGLSTASVLAMNGLSWKTVIFPGQILRLTKTAKASSSTSRRYTIRKGDTITSIASRHSVTVSALLEVNNLRSTSIIYPGTALLIPSRHSSSSRPSVTPASAPSSHTRPSTYTIRTGDTITSVARKFDVSVAAVLAANGLTPSSIIYAGRTIHIPSLSTASFGSQVVALSPAMAENAKTIISVGRHLGVSDYGIIIALSAAAQESGLRNLTSGDRDSVGLFQQRPSQGWGTRAQLHSTTHASRLFYGGPKNPNKGETRGLLDIKGWHSMSVTKAAQAVQVSAFPNAYAKWETSARAWLKHLG